MLGKVRPIQSYDDDENTYRTAIAVLLYGDAAFA